MNIKEDIYKKDVIVADKVGNKYYGEVVSTCELKGQIIKFTIKEFNNPVTLKDFEASDIEDIIIVDEDFILSDFILTDSPIN